MSLFDSKGTRTTADLTGGQNHTSFGDDTGYAAQYYASGSGAPFTISGLEAVQTRDDLTLVKLKGPAIDFKGDSNKSTHISSASGLYDVDRGLFHLTGNVVMRSGGSDMTFRTEAAVINLKDLTISGDRRIEGTGSMGHIVGESFMISKNGADVVFRGRGDNKVWTTLNRK